MSFSLFKTRLYAFLLDYLLKMLLVIINRIVKLKGRIVEDSVSRCFVEKGTPGNGSLSAVLHDAGSFDVATGKRVISPPAFFHIE